MSCEKYVKWRNGHNSQLESEQLPERSELSADREQTQNTQHPKFMGAASFCSLENTMYNAKADQDGMFLAGCQRFTDEFQTFSLQVIRLSL